MKNIQFVMLAVVLFIVAMGAFIIGFSLRVNHSKGLDISSSKSEVFDNRLNETGLMSKDLKHRVIAAERIRNDRDELIKQLIELAREKVEQLPSSDSRFVEYPWHDSKHLATLLLGELRATQAVPVLLDNIEYKNARLRYVDEPLDQGGWYPAAEALSKIGIPAVGPTIEKLGSYDKDCFGRELCCWIIKEVLGSKLGKVRLEMAIAETKDETVKKNLTAALPYFKTQQEKASEERARREKAGKQEPLSKTEK
jgi:hypothetical protein